MNLEQEPEGIFSFCWGEGKRALKKAEGAIFPGPGERLDLGGIVSSSSSCSAKELSPGLEF